MTLVVALAALSVGCGESAARDASVVLRIGVIPDCSEGLRERYAPLLARLESHVGIPCELVVPESYDALVTAFRAGSFDFAYFGGYTYIEASTNGIAVPLVMRKRDREYTSVVLVAADSPARSLADLRGASFAFWARLSTSGHLMPRTFLAADGIEPESFFRDVRYSRAHDTTARWVADGEVDAGVASAAIVGAMFADERLSRDTARAIWESPAYPDSEWCAREDVPMRIQHRLIEAFLSLTDEEPSDRAVLKALNAAYFLPASDAEFEMVQSAVHEWEQREQGP